MLLKSGLGLVCFKPIKFVIRYPLISYMKPKLNNFKKIFKNRNSNRKIENGF